MNLTMKQFEDAIIAQHDDDDYWESGYAITVIGNEAAIWAYGHCSCYGTWEAISGHGDYSWDPDNKLPKREVTPTWSGTVDQLIDMAANGADPAMPDRAATDDDYDYNQLMECYKQVIEWSKTR